MHQHIRILQTSVVAILKSFWFVCGPWIWISVWNCQKDCKMQR